jgi:hypothetical protein
MFVFFLWVVLVLLCLGWVSNIISVFIKPKTEDRIIAAATAVAAVFIIYVFLLQLGYFQ